MSYFASNYMILNGSTLTFETGDQDNYSVLARSNIKNDYQKHPEKAMTAKEARKRSLEHLRCLNIE